VSRCDRHSFANSSIRLIVRKGSGQLFSLTDAQLVIESKKDLH